MEYGWEGVTTDVPLGRTVLAGVAGAAAVTALNEVGRRVLRDAPRVELLGARGVRKLARRAGHRPDGRQAFWIALAAEVLTNGSWYALAAQARRPRRAAVWLGALAGAGAVLLPGALGIGTWPTRRTARTAALSFAWYLAGGLAAAAVLGSPPPRLRR
ncbi:hypothetical protein [Anaeromyxobacter oryzae]|uniref:Uncharacterized protein n=1 Tax=Anaeromyxobacter oryzae TaxID=2918170 RepID=A0ABM7WX00_9BACT|nr:hypothetical protein [Anaeromyxobacter oryzae]BDG04022.1 hypothetical protein AMOR_30180 [Anaeromyxobacter oryzae]